MKHQPHTLLQPNLPVLFLWMSSTLCVFFLPSLFNQTTQAHAQTHIGKRGAHTQQTSNRRRRRKRRRKKRPYRTHRPYVRLAALSPGGCFDPSPACPQGTRFKPTNFGSLDLSIGYRWRNFTLEGRMFGNSYSIAHTPTDEYPNPSGTFGSIFTVATKYMPVTGRNRFDPFVTVGLGWMGASISQANPNPNSPGIVGLSPMIGAGADYFLTRYFAMGLEYDTFFIPTEDPNDTFAEFWTARLNFTLYFQGSERSRRRTPRRKAPPKTRPQPPKTPRNPEPYRPPRRKPTR